MFLTAKSIRRLIAELDPPLIKIVDGTDEQLDEFVKHIEFLEGSVFDFTLDRIEIQSDRNEIPFFGKDERIIPRSWEYTFQPTLTGRPNTWRLFQGTSYKLQSLETINLPPFLCAFLDSRTSIFRGQGALSVTRIHPGYSGKITAELHVIDGCIDIQRGFRFCQASFGMFIGDAVVSLLQEMDPVNPDEIDIYNGIWGTHTNDRTTTESESVRAF